MTQRWAMRCVLGTTSPATKTRVRACAEREGPLLRVWRRARRSEARRGTTDVTVDGGALQGAADKACEGAEGETCGARTESAGGPGRDDPRIAEISRLSLKVSSDMSSVLAASVCA